MDDVRQILDVDPAGGNIRCQQKGHIAFAEFIHGVFALGFAVIAVQHADIDAFELQFLRQIIKFLRSIYENERLHLFQIAQTAQHFGAFARRCLDEAVNRLVHELAFFCRVEPKRLGVEPLLDVLQVFAVRSRKETHLTGTRHFFDQLAQGAQVLLLHQIVRFIKDDRLDVVQFQFFLVGQFQQSSRCSDHDFRFFLQLVDLTADVRAADDHLRAQVLQGTPLRQNVAYLVSQLLRRHKHQQLQLFVGIRFLQQRNGISQRFTRSCRR